MTNIRMYKLNRESMPPQTVVVNEVLTFIFHRIQSATLDDIRRTLLDFYEDSAISSAKSTLWDGYQIHLDATFNTKRNNRERSKKEKEVEEILSGIRDIEKVFSRNEDLPVLFAATNLENLPLISCAGASEPSTLSQRVALLELQMIEVLKDRGASNNGSHPKQTSDSSHPDVPLINRTETTATDTNDQCQTQQSAHQSATDDPVVMASLDESPQTEGRLTDGLHLPPAIEQPKHKELPAQNNIHDTGHADSSFSNKLNNGLTLSDSIKKKKILWGIY